MLLQKKKLGFLTVLSNALKFKPYFRKIGLLAYIFPFINLIHQGKNT
jgi:hypothetical protein